MAGKLIIVHPMDPRGVKVGGIETHVRQILRHAPASSDVLLIGVDDRTVDSVVTILKETCERRTRLIPAGPNIVESAAMMGAFVEVEVGGATVFIMDVEHFEQV